jgi:hypothetical protein
MKRWRSSLCPASSPCSILKAAVAPLRAGRVISAQPCRRTPTAPPASTSREHTPDARLALLEQWASSLPRIGHTCREATPRSVGGSQGRPTRRSGRGRRNRGRGDAEEQPCAPPGAARRSPYETRYPTPAARRAGGLELLQARVDAPGRGRFPIPRRDLHSDEAVGDPADLVIRPASTTSPVSSRGAGAHSMDPPSHRRRPARLRRESPPPRGPPTRSEIMGG